MSNADIFLRKLTQRVADLERLVMFLMTRVRDGGLTNSKDPAVRQAHERLVDCVHVEMGIEENNLACQTP